MVKPSLLLGVAPLIGYASALYLPHHLDEDISTVATNAGNTHRTEDDSVQGDGGHSPESDAKQAGSISRNKGIHIRHRKNKKVAADVSVQPIRTNPELKVDGIVTHVNPEKIIPDSYIVVLKNGVKLEDALGYVGMVSQYAVETLLENGGTHELVKDKRSEGFEITHIYNKLSFSGYAGKLLPQVAELIAKHPDVAFVERDSKVHALSPKTEEQAPWGLARVSHRDPLGLGSYNQYLYDGEGGSGVTSYIVDTGIYIDHEDFEGRAKWGKTMPAGDSDVDAHGHGSHCAGTIGGKRYGVAKKADLVAVKVLGSDGSGSMSDVIGGVEYVVESHRAEKKRKGKKFKGSTANMSLGGGKSPALDLAVNAATEAGVHFAVAAGNENQDACNTSPAGAEGPITVGATTVGDDRAYFSNYGQCVDIFAPGLGILSVGTSSPSANAVMSGTSMASPHIAGLLTYFISLQPSTDSQYSTRGAISTKELKKYLIQFGTKNAIKDLDSESPNVIAYNGAGKDISAFWGGKEGGNEKHDESFLEKIEHAVEGVIEDIEDSVNDFF